ncbi:hypothetical protein GCM10027212_16440 [Actinotalea caeni]
MRAVARGTGRRGVARATPGACPVPPLPRPPSALPLALLPLPTPLTEESAAAWAASHADDEFRRDAERCVRMASVTGRFDPETLHRGVQLEALGRAEGWW